MTIRLTDERLIHIVSTHPEISFADINEILEIVRNPTAILKGDVSEFLATSKFGESRWLVVAYKEEKSDGFIITSYITTDYKWLFKRKIIWTKK